MQRCGWVTSDPMYIEYHDKEWGVPQKDRQALFEILCLESQQAGLSWITVLKKRENYRAAFHHFDPQAVALMEESDVERLLQNRGIIRHRGKISAIIANAQALLAMEALGESFTEFVWSYVNHQPQQHDCQSERDIPSRSPASDALARALKKRGFRFVGSTTCYAFMQAAGLINDHTTVCFCHPDNLKQR